MKSLEKALQLLRVFLDNNIENISLSELSRLSGLNKAATIRIVAALTKYGYLKQPQKRGKYHLGPSFADFSRIISQKQQLRQIAQPHLNRLANIAKDCVVLTVLDGDQAFVMEVIDSKQVLRTTLSSGTYIPLYCTGQGKAILANLSEVEIGNYINTVSRKQHTVKTLTGADELRSNLCSAAKEGIAFDIDEQYDGIHNIASAIFNTEGKVFASVGVLGPAIRLTDSRMRELVPYVRQCAQSISRDLGSEEAINRTKSRKRPSNSILLKEVQ